MSCDIITSRGGWRNLVPSEEEFYPHINVDGKMAQFLNLVEEDDLVIKFKPIVDVCDVEASFITVQEFFDIYWAGYKVEHDMPKTYNIESGYGCNHENGIDVYKLQDLGNLVKTAIEKAKGKKNQIWYRYESLFGASLDESRMNIIKNMFWRSQVPHVIMRDTWSNKKQESIISFALRSTYEESERVRRASKPKPKKIVKCGLTYDELNALWGHVAYALECVLRNNGVGVKVLGGVQYRYKLPELIKFAKSIGVTEEQFCAYSWYKEYKKNFPKVWRSPNRWAMERPKKD